MPKPAVREPGGHVGDNCPELEWVRAAVPADAAKHRQPVECESPRARRLWRALTREETVTSHELQPCGRQTQTLPDGWAQQPLPAPCAVPKPVVRSVTW
jgi:hypothetical protein